MNSPYDLFFGVIPDFRSCTSIFAYVYSHEILMKDALHGIWEVDIEKIFNDIVQMDKTQTPVRADGVFFRISINLQQKNVQYVRRAYTFLDALGDIGGLREGLILTFAFMLSPFYHQIWAYDIFFHHQEYLPESKRKKVKTSFKCKWCIQDTLPNCLFKCLCCNTNWDKYEKLQRRIEL